MMATTSSWPPAEGLSTPTVHRKDATFATSASVHINAPAALVFDAVLTLSDYPKWNNFVPEAKIVVQPQGGPVDFDRLQIGTIFDFYVVMNSAKPNSRTQTGLMVSDMSTPDKSSDYLAKANLDQDPSFTSDLSKVYRVSWAQHGGFASKGLKTERFHEIIILGDGSECEVRTWEVYGGLLARTVKWLYQSTLNDKFRLWSDDLKKYVESEKAAKATA